VEVILMMTREEYIQMEMTFHRELSVDICLVHGISTPEFDRSIYDVMSDTEINAKIHAYEESLKRDYEASLKRRCNYNTDTGEIFYETVYTADGQGRTQLKQQLGEFIDRTGSGFRTYDGSHGHCELCGRLGCHGSCFK
jgi:hypothetical protein